MLRSTIPNMRIWNIAWNNGTFPRKAQTSCQIVRFLCILHSGDKMWVWVKSAIHVEWWMVIPLLKRHPFMIGLWWVGTWKISTSTFCFCPLCVLTTFWNSPNRWTRVFPPIVNKHRKKEKSDPQKEKNITKHPGLMMKNDERCSRVVHHHRLWRVHLDTIWSIGLRPTIPAATVPASWPVMILGIFGAPLFKQKRDGKVWEKTTKKTSGILLDVG